MSEQRPIEAAVMGGGYGTITAAFELTKPEHRGKYHVTFYQLAWRLGGRAFLGEDRPIESRGTGSG